MSNKDIQGFLNATYNGWFCKWRDILPDDGNSKEWQDFTDEGIALIEKYQAFEDPDFEPCQIIIQQLFNILVDRKRKN